jgi:hypothetical protein
MCNVHQDKIRLFDILSAHNPKIKLVFRYVAARARTCDPCTAGERYGGVWRGEGPRHTGRQVRPYALALRQVLPAALDVQGGQAVLRDQLDSVSHVCQSAPRGKPFSLPRVPGFRWLRCPCTRCAA